MTDRCGSRGGNVRDLDTARALQEEHKNRWTAAVRQAIRETFLSKGELHADDLAALEIPAEHQSIIGSQIARLVNRKLIVATDRRKCVHPAANGRKANVYKLTELGRKKLARISAGVPTPQGPGGARRHVPCCASTDSGERSEEGPSCHGASQPSSEPARLFDPPPSAYDPFSEAA
jgi:hypothetical protein